jgi:hypothetical protein
MSNHKDVHRNHVMITNNNGRLFKRLTSGLFYMSNNGVLEYITPESLIAVSFTTNPNNTTTLIIY